MNLYRRFFPVLLLLILIAGLVSNAAMLLRLNQPWGGFFTQWSQKDQAYLIIPGNYPYAPGLASGDVRPGDLIHKVVGVDLNYHNLPAAYRVLYDGGQQSVEYVLSRGRHTIQTQGPLLPFRWQDFWDFRSSFILTGLALWVMALVVFKATDAESNLAFATFTLATCAQILPGTYEFDGSWEVLGRLLTMVTMIAFLPLVGASLIHFAFTFPSTTPRRIRLARLAYLPSFLILLPYEYAIWNVKRSTPLLDRIDHLGNTWSVAYAALGMGLLFLRFLFLARHKGGSVRERRQSRWILLSFGVGILIPALPYALYELFPTLLVRPLDFPAISFFFVLFMAYAILRYQLFRGRQIIMTLLVIIALGGLLTQLLVTVSPSLSYGIVFMELFAVSLATSLFWQGKTRLNRLLDRLLRRDVNRYAQLSRFIQATSHISDVRRLAEKIVQQLVQDFEAGYVGLWLCREDKLGSPGHVFLAEEVSAPSAASSAIANDVHRVAAWLDQAEKVDHIPDPFQIVEGQAVLIPLYGETDQLKQLLGAMVLGPRWTGEVYDQADLDLLKLIAQQAAAALLIVRQVARLREEPRRILIELERERDRIARDLHDTIQQELGALPFVLDEIESSISGDERTRRLFETCYESIAHMSIELQEIRHNLSPIELRRHDFSIALRQLAAKTFASTDIKVYIACDLKSRLQESQTRALYRVCQQAFTNILQHAQATHVKVRVTQSSPHQLEVKIVDDGRGFNMPGITTLQLRGHEGIAGMQGRVQALGGEFLIRSQPGEGTTVEISLPVRCSSHHANPVTSN